jgi:hypothetical protein
MASMPQTTQPALSHCCFVRPSAVSSRSAMAWTALPHAFARSWWPRFHPQWSGDRWAGPEAPPLCPEQSGICQHSEVTDRGGGLGAAAMGAVACPPPSMPVPFSPPTGEPTRELAPGGRAARRDRVPTRDLKLEPQPDAGRALQLAASQFFTLAEDLVGRTSISFAATLPGPSTARRAPFPEQPRRPPGPLEAGVYAASRASTTQTTHWNPR